MEWTAQGGGWWGAGEKLTPGWNLDFDQEYTVKKKKTTGLYSSK